MDSTRQTTTREAEGKNEYDALKELGNIVPLIPEAEQK